MYYTQVPSPKTVRLNLKSMLVAQGLFSHINWASCSPSQWTMKAERIRRCGDVSGYTIILWVREYVSSYTHEASLPLDLQASDEHLVARCYKREYPFLSYGGGWIVCLMHQCTSTAPKRHILILLSLFIWVNACFLFFLLYKIISTSDKLHAV